MLIETYSEEETRKVAFDIGEKAEPGSIYTLIGDLGVGKTIFAQGLAEGLGIREMVNSPTFTIVQIYEEGRLPFFHFDVYRIGSDEEMDDIGYYDIIDGDGVCLIEWAGIIKDILPETYFNVIISVC